MNDPQSDPELTLTLTVHPGARPEDVVYFIDHFRQTITQTQENPDQGSEDNDLTWLLENWELHVHEPKHDEDTPVGYVQVGWAYSGLSSGFSEFWYRNTEDNTIHHSEEMP